MTSNGRGWRRQTDSCYKVIKQLNTAQTNMQHIIYAYPSNKHQSLRVVLSLFIALWFDSRKRSCFQATYISMHTFITLSFLKS
jgi:hypothetical protein